MYGSHPYSVETTAVKKHGPLSAWGEVALQASSAGALLGARKNLDDPLALAQPAGGSVTLGSMDGLAGLEVGNHTDLGTSSNVVLVSINALLYI